jgi:hypothetical protein
VTGRGVEPRAVDVDLGVDGRAGLELPEASCRVVIRGRCGLAPGEAERLTFLRQVHAALILECPEGGEEADGMVFPRGGGVPALRVADCLPVLAAGPGFLAAAHAGWRGLAGGIVRRLAESLPAPPQAVVLGPSICGGCYEVGSEVKEAMSGLTDLRRHPPGRLDLAMAAADQLAAAGLAAETRVYRIGPCTLCGGAPLFSYRGGDTRERNHIWIEEI